MHLEIIPYFLEGLVERRIIIDKLACSPHGRIQQTPYLFQLPTCDSGSHSGRQNHIVRVRSGSKKDLSVVDVNLRCVISCINREPGTEHSYIILIPRNLEWTGLVSEYFEIDLAFHPGLPDHLSFIYTYA